MSDESQKPAPFPPIAPENAKILTQIAVRWQRVFEQQAFDKAQLAEVQARVSANSADIERLKTAALALGADPTRNGWFAPIRAAAGEEAFDAAMADAGFIVNWASPNRSQTVLPQDEKPEAVHLPASASIRELVLERLHLAGNTGARGHDIRQYIEKLRGETLHDKTIGMTLYRLSLDRLTYRKGRIWFLAQEAKNPGAATPGLFNRDDEEEGNA
jgi:hypothetical protein